MFGVRVGVSVRAWVQWQAVREVCGAVWVAGVREARHAERFESQSQQLPAPAPSALQDRTIPGRQTEAGGPKGPRVSSAGEEPELGDPQEPAFCVCITQMSDRLSPAKSPDISATFPEALGRRGFFRSRCL